MARYLPDVDRLGAERAFRALGYLAQVGNDIDTGDGAELVDGFFRIELRCAGPLVVCVLDRGDQGLPVTNGVRERDADYPELFDAAPAVDALVDLGGHDAGPQEVGDELVGAGGDVAEVEAAGVGSQAHVEGLCCGPVDGDVELGVEVGHDLRRRGGPRAHQVVLGVERVVLVVVDIEAGARLGHGYSRSVCAGCVGDEQVVIRRKLVQGLVGQEPAQIFGRPFRVAEYGRGPQPVHETHEGGRSADGVAVRTHVGRYGDAVQGLQELRYLSQRIILRARLHQSLPP